MKIAIFYNLHFGGAKRVVREHARGLKNLGNHVDIYTLEHDQDILDPESILDKKYLYKFQLHKGSIPLLSRLYKDIQIFYSLKNLHKKIARDIDSREYDIVLVHSDNLTQSPFLLRFLKTNNVYYCLEPLRIAYEYSLRIPESIRGLNRMYEICTRMIRKNIDRTNARSAKNILTLSLFGREYIIHAFDRYPKISYLGVDINKFHPVTKKKKNQILFVAEKEYIYGYDLAIEAMKLIPENIRPKLKVVFGTNKKQRISDEDLIQLYSESIITLSLSRFDTFGLVPLESMACATPVIALNVAGYRETIIDGKTGFLVDFDVKDIAETILFCLNKPEKIKQMGINGRRWVKKYWSWEKQIKLLESFLKEFSSQKKIQK